MTTVDKLSIAGVFDEAYELDTWLERKRVLCALDAYRHIVGHVVGHAVAGLALGGNIIRISVDPVCLKDQLVIDAISSPSTYLMIDLYGEAKLISSLAGSYGDTVYTGSADTAITRSDRVEAESIALTLICKTSADEFMNAGSDIRVEEMLEAAETKANEMVKLADTRTREMFIDARIVRSVRYVCEELIERGTLTGNDVLAIVHDDINSWQQDNANWISTLDAFHVNPLIIRPHLIPEEA